MLSMIIISSGALAIAIIGCAVIWGMDARRADEIDRVVLLELGADVAICGRRQSVCDERGPNVQR